MQQKIYIQERLKAQQDSRDLTKNQTLSLIPFIMLQIDRLFPLGGITRVDVMDKLRQNHNKLIKQTQLAMQLNRIVSAASSQEQEDFLSKHCNPDNNTDDRLLGAYACSLAYCAFTFFRDYAHLCIKNGTTIEVVNLTYHTMLVLGRRQDSNPKDIETWGEEAIIFDPWARIHYPASDFKSRQQRGPHIPLLTPPDEIPSYPLPFIIENLYVKSYLEGTPNISAAFDGFKQIPPDIDRDAFFIGNDTFKYMVGKQSIPSHLRTSYISPTGNFRCKPCFFSVHDQFPQKLKIILERQGATIKTPVLGLHNAAHSGNLHDLQEIVSMLNRAELNESTGPDKRNALHYAALSGHWDCYDYLVDAGADPTIVDAFYTSATDYRNQQPVVAKP